MKHRVAGRKLGMRSSHREAMLQNMISSLYRHGRILTTVGKAKEARPLADHYVSVAKKGDLSSRRQLLRFIPDKDVVKKLFNEIAKWSPARTSGFTRIIPAGWRRGDGAPVAFLEMVDRPIVKEEKSKEKGKGKTVEKPAKTQAKAPAKAAAK